jgi:hypothetical protein
VSLRKPSFLLLPIAVTPSILYSLTTAGRKSILITDLLSMSLAHNALTILKIDSFQTGCILLGGLFLYDIWWVFGTNVVRGHETLGSHQLFSSANVNYRFCFWWWRWVRSCAHVDGDSCDVVGCPHQALMAKVAGTRWLGASGAYDARARRRRRTWRVYRAGVEIRFRAVRATDIESRVRETLF